MVISAKPANGTDPGQEYLYPVPSGPGNVYSFSASQEGFILNSPEQRVRQRRDATGALAQGRNAGAILHRPSHGVSRQQRDGLCGCGCGIWDSC